MGLEYGGLFGHFAPVKVNEHLSLDFDNRENFQGSHYAFIVTDEEFDGILGRVQSAVSQAVVRSTVQRCRPRRSADSMPLRAMRTPIRVGGDRRPSVPESLNREAP